MAQIPPNTDPPTLPETPPVEPPNLDKPEEITLPKAKFDDRLNRAEKSGRSKALKELGFNSIEEAIQFRKDFEKNQEAIEQARRAEMNEIERLKADIEQRDKEKEALEAKAAQDAFEREQAEMRGEILTACAERGITNTGYAMYLVEAAVEKMGDDDELDAGEFLDSQIKDDQNKVALGLSGDPVQIPARTSTGGEEPPPKANEDNGEFDAINATPEEMNAHLKALGVPGY